MPMLRFSVFDVGQLGGGGTSAIIETVRICMTGNERVGPMLAGGRILVPAVQFGRGAAWIWVSRDV